MIVIFWSSPVLTTDRVLFNVLWTIWVVTGAILEERNLADAFGGVYRDYQQTVPLLIPRGLRPAYRNSKSKNPA
jgi:methanethiol S-methyltransferase